MPDKEPPSGEWQQYAEGQEKIPSEPPPAAEAKERSIEAVYDEVTEKIRGLDASRRDQLKLEAKYGTEALNAPKGERDSVDLIRAKEEYSLNAKDRRRLEQPIVQAVRDHLQAKLLNQAETQTKESVDRVQGLPESQQRSFVRAAISEALEESGLFPDPSVLEAEFENRMRLHREHYKSPDTPGKRQEFLHEWSNETSLGSPPKNYERLGFHRLGKSPDATFFNENDGRARLLRIVSGQDSNANVEYTGVPGVHPSGWEGKIMSVKQASEQYLLHAKSEVMTEHDRAQAQAGFARELKQGVANALAEQFFAQARNNPSKWGDLSKVLVDLKRGKLAAELTRAANKIPPEPREE